MPRAHVLRQSKIERTFRVEQVRGMFDVPEKGEVRHEWTVSLPVEEKAWHIGAIVGPSGAGKTTIAKECFPDAYFHERFQWPRTQSLLEGFPAEASAQDITAALNAVGFSSPPQWLKRFDHLSNGQKFRAELARCLLLDTPVVIFDEFTSVVDREVAKICSAAVSKTLRRRQGPQLIAVSCHYDIIDWLQPDWVFDVAANRFEWRILRRRPEIKLRIYRTDRTTWALFRGHHYLSADLHAGAYCYVATMVSGPSGQPQERPVAFCAVLHFPHPTARNIKRGSRVVVLPDYQGVGIGNRVAEYVAGLFKRSGYRYLATSAHPAMIRHRARSKSWRLVRKIGHTSNPSKTSTTGLDGTCSTSRLTATFEYVGEDI